LAERDVSRIGGAAIAIVMAVRHAMGRVACGELFDD
jgi:hypothetical protein